MTTKNLSKPIRGSSSPIHWLRAKKSEHIEQNCKIPSSSQINSPLSKFQFQTKPKLPTPFRYALSRAAGWNHRSPKRNTNLTFPSETPPLKPQRTDRDRNRRARKNVARRRPVALRSRCIGAPIWSRNPRSQLPLKHRVPIHTFLFLLLLLPLNPHPRSMSWVSVPLFCFVILWIYYILRISVACLWNWSLVCWLFWNRFAYDHHQRRWWLFVMCLEDGVGRSETQVGRLRVSLETHGSIVRFLFCFVFVSLFLSPCFCLK